MNWIFKEWQNVRWIDESKYEVVVVRGVYVRKKSGERLNGKCVARTQYHNWGSVMALGCFRGKRMRFDSGQGNPETRTISFDFAKTFYTVRIIGKTFTFQQFKDPKYVKITASQKRKPRNWKIMSW